MIAIYRSKACRWKFLRSGREAILWARLHRNTRQMRELSSTDHGQGLYAKSVFISGESLRELRCKNCNSYIKEKYEKHEDSQQVNIKSRKSIQMKVKIGQNLERWTMFRKVWVLNENLKVIIDVIALIEDTASESTRLSPGMLSLHSLWKRFGRGPVHCRFVESSSLRRVLPWVSFSTISTSFYFIHWFNRFILFIQILFQLTLYRVSILETYYSCKKHFRVDLSAFQNPCNFWKLTEYCTVIHFQKFDILYLNCN